MKNLLGNKAKGSQTANSGTITVPWNIFLGVKDEFGNTKQIAAHGQATVGVRDGLRAFYTLHGNIIVSRLLNNLVGNFGWQVLLPENEKTTALAVADTLKDINLVKIGLTSVREWDLEQFSDIKTGESANKYINERTLYKKIEEREETGGQMGGQ